MHCCPMPSLEKMSADADTFLSEILPKASVSSQWNQKAIDQALCWASFAEELHTSAKNTGRLSELDQILERRGLDSGKTLLYRSSNLEKATMLLLEEFLRNPKLLDESFLSICKSARRNMDESSFQEMLLQIVERKQVYQQAVHLVQNSQDSAAITSTKAMILKEDLLADLSRLKSKLDPLLKSAPTLEIVLMVLALTADSNQVSDVKLRTLIVEAIESLVEDWLHGLAKPHTVAALLAAPVKLTRQISQVSVAFQASWHNCLARLASNLKPAYYSGEHAWNWPSSEDHDDVVDGLSPQLHGVWFSFDQLYRHFQCLTSMADDVGERSRQFLSQRQQSAADCSIWMEIEQRLALTR